MLPPICLLSSPDKVLSSENKKASKSKNDRCGQETKLLKDSVVERSSVLVQKRNGTKGQTVVELICYSLFPSKIRASLQREEFFREKSLACAFV